MIRKKKTYFFIYFFMILIMVFIAIWSLSAGSVNITTRNIMDVLLFRIQEGTARNIIIDIRMPRIIAAIILGGALSVSGFLLQTFFSNPIAGPYVLGISSGAKMVVAFFLILTLKTGIHTSSVGMILAAFIGALISTGFVLLISRKTDNMSLLVVCGILIGYICSAITDLLVTFADDTNIVNLHNWSMGSLSGMDWSDVRIMTLIVVLTVLTAFLMSKPISAYQMGEAYAKSMGINVKNLRIIIIVLSSILSATVTAFAGPVSFVGIAVPHMIKSITKTAKPIIHIPACFLGGGIVTLLCDGIARVVFAPTELAIGTVTSVALVPIVISMMLKNRGSRYE